jgi:SAM-dependent methyltransferase
MAPAAGDPVAGDPAAEDPAPRPPSSGPGPGPGPSPQPGQRRWQELLAGLAGLLPEGARCVFVDGPAEQARLLVARLIEELAERGHPAWVTADAGLPADLRVYLRAGPGDAGRREREERADIVVDVHDPGWPVIRRVSAPLAGRGSWYLTETRAFFACRAATWDSKFGDDLPAYRAAVGQAGIGPGGVVLDVGCGTGRALLPLRAAVGPGGRVIGVDVTPEMLRVAAVPGAAAGAALLLADARGLPLADGAADAVFAAGLVSHLLNPVAGLRELARVTRPGGLLVLFHPSGRAALAARHGRRLAPHEPLAEGPLRRLTAASGWRLTAYDDAEQRFFAVAEREPAR